MYQESTKRKRKLDAEFLRQSQETARARHNLQERIDLQTDIVELHNARALLRVTQFKVKELEFKVVPCFCGELVYRKSVTCNRDDCKRMSNLTGRSR